MLRWTPRIYLASRRFARCTLSSGARAPAPATSARPPRHVAAARAAVGDECARRTWRSCIRADAAVRPRRLAARVPLRRRGVRPRRLLEPRRRRGVPPGRRVRRRVGLTPPCARRRARSSARRARPPSTTPSTARPPSSRPSARSSRPRRGPASRPPPSGEAAPPPRRLLARAADSDGQRAHDDASDARSIGALAWAHARSASRRRAEKTATADPRRGPGASPRGARRRSRRPTPSLMARGRRRRSLPRRWRSRRRTARRRVPRSVPVRARGGAARAHAVGLRSRPRSSRSRVCFSIIASI